MNRHEKRHLARMLKKTIREIAGGASQTSKHANQQPKSALNQHRAELNKKRNAQVRREKIAKVAADRRRQARKHKRLARA